MPPARSNQREAAAVDAMKEFFIPPTVTKRALKRLLKETKNNWEYIEADNYNVLADHIYEAQASQPQECKKKKVGYIKEEAVGTCVEREPYETRSKMKRDVEQFSLVNWTPEKKPRMVVSALPSFIKKTAAPEIALVRKYSRDVTALICSQEKEVSPQFQFEEPLAVIPSHIPLAKEKERTTREGPSVSNVPTRINGSHLREEHSTNEKENQEESLTVAGPTNEIIASSDTGEVKLSFTFSTDRPGFHMPSMDDVFKMVEDRCLKSYKILEPSFSMMNLMKEMCQCALELGSESNGNKGGNVLRTDPVLDSLENTRLRDMPGFGSNDSLNLPILQNSQVNKEDIGNGNIKDCTDPKVSYVLVAAHPPRLALAAVRPHDVDDIAKGEERLRIPIAKDFSEQMLPAYFYYMRNNAIFQNACVNISHAQIGDKDCCSDCFADCLGAPIPCACARETGGEFAYSPDGLIKNKFLEECISMNRNPEKYRCFYCKSCPLKRVKNEVAPDSCKGHLIRKFVKECWTKCGCNKQCGNRVVQRGITCNLEVFFTGKAKGWGLRSLDGLPKGAFVCEYVGEILTNLELYERTRQTTSNARRAYPVLLDAYWGTKGIVKDEEALFLDATFYGNIATFVNHRCHDANLIEIPVEVEMPDRHYYHVALFTTREVEAFEELTWDYGIDFEDHDHPIKAFRCLCGSKYCRDVKLTKTRSPN